MLVDIVNLGVVWGSLARTKGEKVARPVDLREAYVQEALAIVETSGVEQLSLREVARRLGVSHQAPYKHFPSRDHILAEITARAFDAFARFLDDQPHTGNPRDDLRALGRAYLSYARDNPLHYRLMFRTPLPNPREHPNMMQKATHAYALLSDGLRRRSGARGEAASDARTALDALFVWSTMHGLASLLDSDIAEALDLPADVMANAAPHALMRIGLALSAGHSQRVSASGHPLDRDNLARGANVV